MYLNNFSASQLNLKHSQVRTGSSAAPRIRSAADLMSSASPKAEFDNDRALLLLDLLTLALSAAGQVTAGYLIESIAYTAPPSRRR